MGGGGVEKRKKIKAISPEGKYESFCGKEVNVPLSPYFHDFWC